MRQNISILNILKPKSIIFTCKYNRNQWILDILIVWSVFNVDVSIIGITVLGNTMIKRTFVEKTVENTQNLLYRDWLKVRRNTIHVFAILKMMTLTKCK